MRRSECLNMMTIPTKGKSDTESAASKKRKTEWTTALKKMPGNVSFAKVGR